MVRKRHPRRPPTHACDSEETGTPSSKPPNTPRVTVTPLPPDDPIYRAGWVLGRQRSLRSRSATPETPSGSEGGKLLPFAPSMDSPAFDEMMRDRLNDEVAKRRESGTAPSSRPSAPARPASQEVEERDPE